MSERTTYAVLYPRPDGWYIAGEGWTDRRAAKRDAEAQMNGASFKVVSTEARNYRKAKELEESW